VTTRLTCEALQETSKVLGPVFPRLIRPPGLWTGEDLVPPGCSYQLDKARSGSSALAPPIAVSGPNPSAAVFLAVVPLIPVQSGGPGSFLRVMRISFCNSFLHWVRLFFFSVPPLARPPSFDWHRNLLLQPLSLRQSAFFFLFRSFFFSVFLPFPALFLFVDTGLSRHALNSGRSDLPPPAFLHLFPLRIEPQPSVVPSLRFAAVRRQYLLIFLFSSPMAH